MADGKPGEGGGGTAVIVVLAICVALGIGGGATGMVRSQGTRSSGGATSSHVVVENADTFAGTFQVRTDSCQDAPSADDVAHVEVSNAGGRVAEADAPVRGSHPVERVRVGRDLPPGNYRVSVQCLSNGQGVGDVFSSTVDVQPEGRTSGTEVPASDQERTSADGGRPTALPNSGR